MSRVFSAGMKAEEEQAQAQGTLPPGETYYLERRVHLATERRRLLGELIEWYRDVYAAARVRILAPFETNDPQRKREVAEWRAKEEARLSEEAPDAVKVALAKNELRRMERDDPEALVRVLRAGRAAEAGDTDDEAS